MNNEQRQAPSEESRRVASPDAVRANFVVMPIEPGMWTNTQALRPHTANLDSTTHGAAIASHKYLSPGPGAYDDSKVEPSTTTKFKRSPGYTWGASGDTRFKPIKTLAPGPGHYKTESAVGAQVRENQTKPNSRRRSSSRLARRGRRDNATVPLVAWPSPTRPLPTTLFSLS